MYNFYAWSKGVSMQKEREKVDCYLKGKARDRKSLCDSWILKLKFKAILPKKLAFNVTDEEKYMIHSFFQHSLAVSIKALYELFHINFTATLRRYIRKLKFMTSNC